MKLLWNRCGCGSKYCELQWPVNLGVFSQGSGFRPEEVVLIDKAFAALEEKEAAPKLR